METAAEPLRRLRAYTPAEKKLLKKIIFAVMPLVCTVQYVQITDKFTLNSAGVMGIYRDASITHDQFSLLGSVFFVGFLFPNTYLLQCLPVSKYFGTIIALWGVVLMCMSLGENFSELAGLRFLLGLLEATSAPTILLVINLYFRRREQTICIAAMQLSSEVAVIFSHLIIYGFGYMDNLHGVSAWKWNFIIWGIVTVFIGVCVFIFLPDQKESRWFRLTPTEKEIVKERVCDTGMVRDKLFKLSHVVESVKETRLYCYCSIALLLCLQNGCVSLYSSQIFRDSGFSKLDSVILNVPRGVSAIILMVIAGYISQRYNDTCRVGAGMVGVFFIGALILATVHNGNIRLLGVYLSTMLPAYVLMQSSCAKNVIGYTKKTFYNACIYVAICIGNFVGPLFMRENEAPFYTSGMVGYMIADAIAITLFIYVYWWHKRENQRRQQLKSGGRIPLAPPNDRDELDLTDKEDLAFVYTY
ncbi:major facilitator superfamily domain-containing protein [Zychaea mexicana]|uniref:major facilitator superfamily domain-containing protein n=1 Tax=Zychaea mexicana TaxID=64656 RepID=UPI0022FE92FB|nr:major facilitator superfamily domain-containing protein [Zychaea mexicana]KAI9497527.1 major facilitator superfamily domain-containing protein [Zychaea mexicana]